MIPTVSLETEQELIDAAGYYAREGGAELGLSFIAEFERVLTLLSRYPRLGAIWRRNRRRFPLRGFPYNVIYYTRRQELRIIALAHQRRKPGYWLTRR